MSIGLELSPSNRRYDTIKKKNIDGDDRLSLWSSCVKFGMRYVILRGRLKVTDLDSIVNDGKISTL